jgi:hypothetical protein
VRASAGERTSRSGSAAQAVDVRVQRLSAGGSCDRSGSCYEWPGGQITTCLWVRMTYRLRSQAPPGTRLVGRYWT